MNKPAIFLRIASTLAFLHAVLHTIGGVFGKAGPGPAAVAVLAMKVNQFPLMGNERSYWDFYRGLALAVTIFLMAEAVVFWQLASLAKIDSRQLRPILAVFLVAYIALAVNSYVYFFLGPVIVEIMIAACLGLAVISVKSRREAYASAV